MKISRKVLLRGAAVIIILAIAVLMFFLGRQHTVLVDNKTIEIDGVTYQALDYAEASVDGMDSKELYPRDRVQFLVMSQSHKLTMTYTDSNWEEHTIEWKFKTPVPEEMMLLSLPAVLAGLPVEKCLTHFESMAITVADIEQGETISIDDTTSLLGDF